MHILEKIIQHKKKEIAAQKSHLSYEDFEQSPYFQLTCHSMAAHIIDPNRSGIIAEIKRQSPSKGLIHPGLSVEKVSTAYRKAGASAISVLTDSHFFGGSTADLALAKALNAIPILRKEFIIDEFQILEAKAIGADAILLIAACLSPEQASKLADFAVRIGLEVLLEVHTQEELLLYSHCQVQMLGVNNRNLKDFSVDIQRSLDLLPHIPNHFVKVAESGLHRPEDVQRLKAAGFQGFLMGQRFVEQAQPGRACAQFIQAL